jgi:hypothetical protein
LRLYYQTHEALVFKSAKTTRLRDSFVIVGKWAHGHGGDRWSSGRKRAFANDPDNLLATYYSANRSKGAKGPDQWMPEINRCSYAQRWEVLIEKYGLLTTTGEMAAIARVRQ